MVTDGMKVANHPTYKDSPGSLGGPIITKVAEVGNVTGRMVRNAVLLV